jgi:hypothetical protein
MLGATSATVTMQSVRMTDGTCLRMTRETVYGGCTTYQSSSRSYTARRVYRPFISQYAANPQGQDAEPGWVVSSVNRLGTECP